MKYGTRGGARFKGHPRFVTEYSPEDLGYSTKGIGHSAVTFGESMVAIQPDLSPGPLLAEAWDISDDGRVWTWRIRDDVWFHNKCGTGRNQSCGNMTIHDVLWSYKEYHEGSLHPAAAIIGDFWVGKAGGSQKVIDDYTVEIDTGEPWLQQRAFDFMRHLGNYSTTIVSMEQTRQIFEARGGNWDDRYQEDDPNTEEDESQLVTREYERAAYEAGTLISATGPWEIEEHDYGSDWKLKAVENHWRQTPYFEEFNMWFIPERTTRIAAFQAGELDTVDMSDMPSDSLTAVQAVEDTEIIVWPNAEQTGLIIYGQTSYHVDGYGNLKGSDCNRAWASCNEDPTSQEWLTAVKVRKAMAIAIDRQSIVANLLSGHGQPLYMMYWMGHEAKADPRWTHEYNPDLARQLLAEAGYGPDNKFSITLGRKTRACKAAAEYWEAIGINVGFNTTFRLHHDATCHTSSKRLVPAMGASDYVAKPTLNHNYSTDFRYMSYMEEAVNDLLFETNPVLIAEKEHKLYGWMYDNVMAFALYSADGIWPVGKRLDPDWRPIDFSELRTPSGFEYIKHRQ